MFFDAVKYIQKNRSKTKQPPKLAAIYFRNHIKSDSNFILIIIIVKFAIYDSTLFDKIKLIDMLKSDLDHVFGEHSDMNA